MTGLWDLSPASPTIIQALVQLCGINDETGSWLGLLNSDELLYLPIVA